jgi:hypothetical protein
MAFADEVPGEYAAEIAGRADKENVLRHGWGF